MILATRLDTAGRMRLAACSQSVKMSCNVAAVREPGVEPGRLAATEPKSEPARA